MTVTWAQHGVIHGAYALCLACFNTEYFLFHIFLHEVFALLIYFYLSHWMCVS